MDRRLRIRTYRSEKTRVLEYAEKEYATMLEIDKTAKALTELSISFRERGEILHNVLVLLALYQQIHIRYESISPSKLAEKVKHAALSHSIPKSKYMELVNAAHFALTENQKNP